MEGIHRWTLWTFVAILLSAGVMTELKVAQTPSSVSATQGGSVLLNCTFEVISSFVGKFGWRRASLNLEISDQIPFYRDRVVRSGQKLFAQKTTFTEIKDLAKFDSDLYVCKVEIPGVGKGKGNGTELIVIDNIIEMPITPSFPRPGEIPPTYSSFLLPDGNTIDTPALNGESIP